MPQYQIFSDGSCDLPYDLAEQNNIQIIPFYVSIDGETYQKEIKELTLDRFYHFIVEQKGFPKTSLPSSQDYIDAFTPSLEKGLDILCFTITETLSSSYASACTAKHMLEEIYPHAKIHIENSWNATGSMALIVLEAAKMQQKGKPIDEVIELVSKAKIDARILFMVGALTHLEKGGRIGKLVALSGSILQIKPLIILKNGEISTAGATRSRKKGIQKLVNLTKEHFDNTKENPADYLFCLGTTNTWEETEEFQALAKKALPTSQFIQPFQIGATIASHTGPGTLGLCFCKRFDCYH